MQVYYGLDSFPASLRGAAVSVGKFDGIHLGHSLIIHRLKSRAGKLNAPSIVLTLDPPPITVLRPQLQAKPICTLSRKIELIEKFHIDAMVVFRTNKEFLEQSAETFFFNVLQDRLDAKIVVEGENFSFGRDRVGNSDMIRHYGNWAGIEVDIVQSVRLGDQTVSSSGIRQLLTEGKVEQANELLSQPYRLSGAVGPGEQRGRTLGFPTANLTGIETIMPKPGIYASVAHLDGKQWGATTHIGTNPTFEEAQIKVEVFIHDFNGDLYGKRLDVDMIAYLREIVRFNSKEELIEQMQHDVHQSREISAIPNP